MKPSPGKSPVKKLIFKSALSPGDIVLLTAAVRDLHLCYPRKFVTDVRTVCPALWENNPYLTPLDEEDPQARVIECHYPLIDRSNTTPYHCLHGFIEFLNDTLGLQIRPTAFKGDIHLSELEKSWYSQIRELTGQDTPFWVISAGGKFDYTIKWWDVRRYQEVVDHFQNRIQFVQVGAVGDYHPKLEGVIDLRGKTDLRQLVRLVYHAQGVLCPVTCLMHLAAAVESKPGQPPNRPCVVVGGGREPNQWEAYPHHQFLHTNGALTCCAQGGCWRSRTTPLGDDPDKDHPDQVCVNVVDHLPRCMHLISADEVIRRIRQYFEGGSIQYLTTGQSRASKLAIVKTRDNSFDERLNRYSAITAADDFIARLPAKPERYYGRGIIICGGGRQYFPGVWITLNLLRRLGCSLPVQIWHLGKEEADAEMVALTEPLNAVWIDAEEVRKKHPARILGGWELKAYALLHSTFKEVLLLDADNVPVTNPELLFETSEFKKHGVILWPDLNALEPDHQRWKIFGVAGGREPEVESGQLVVDKARCWKPIALSWWYNDHSDFYHQHSEGDKETFHMAFRKLGHAYAMPEKLPTTIKVGLCQHDFQGRRLFQHRCWDKWNLFRNNRRDPEFQHEAECFAFLETIRSRWDRKRDNYRWLEPPARIKSPRRRSTPASAGKVTLVTLYNGAFYDLARITAKRMREYARIHGYRFVEHKTLLDQSRHPAWNKILAVRQAMSSCRTDWIMWLDADAVIMNYDYRVENLIPEGCDLIFGSDFNGLNSAVFLARNCAWCRQFFETIYRLGDVNYIMDRYGPKWEQNTIKHVLNNFTGYADHVALHPEGKMNALPDAYADGDFILHLGGLSQEERFKALREYNLVSAACQ
jgi:ADP-heptose:LPS heptosyltransferase